MFYPTTIAHRLIAPHPMTQRSVSIAVSEHELIKELAQQGDCVIVGRCADIVLREMHPMNIFVYADQQSKLNRCKRRADGNERFSEKEMLKKMKQIDKERAAYRGNVKSYAQN